MSASGVGCSREIVALQGAPVAAAAAAAAAQPHEAGALGARVGDYLAWQMAGLPLCRPSGSGAYPLGTGECPVQHRRGSQSGCRPSSGPGPQIRLPRCPSGSGCRTRPFWRSTLTPGRAPPTAPGRCTAEEARSNGEALQRDRLALGPVADSPPLLLTATAPEAGQGFVTRAHRWMAFGQRVPPARQPPANAPAPAPAPAPVPAPAPLPSLDMLSFGGGQVQTWLLESESPALGLAGRPPAGKLAQQPLWCLGSRLTSSTRYQDPVADRSDSDTDSDADPDEARTVHLGISSPHPTRSVSRFSLVFLDSCTGLSLYIHKLSLCLSYICFYVCPSKCTSYSRQPSSVPTTRPRVLSTWLFQPFFPPCDKPTHPTFQVNMSTCVAIHSP